VAQGGEKVILCPARCLGLDQLALGSHLPHHSIHCRRDELHKVWRLQDVITHSRAKRLHQALFVAKTGHENRRPVEPFRLQGTIKLEAA
jgi:hypothetical protein